MRVASNAIWIIRAVLLAAALPICASSAEPAQPVVESWAPPPISSAQFESHPAFDPWNGDFYFVRSSPEFKGWRILVSRCTSSGWSEPVSPSFAGDGVEADPFFFDEGRSLYFISTRSTDGIQRQDLDIWRVDRTREGGWQKPVRLPEPINSTGQEWFPRPAPDGWLYFGSDRSGGFGRTDIWRAQPIPVKKGQAVKWQVVNAGAAFNTAADEYELLPSADGQSMILKAADGLYQSRSSGNGWWSAREKLPPGINVNGSEIGPLFSPSGKSLLFARDTKAPLSGELFVWRRAGTERWPPPCPN
jgi:hypothetical protein